MPKVIEVPNLGTVEFPDDTPDEAISSSITDHLDRVGKKAALGEEMAATRRERFAGDVGEKAIKGAEYFTQGVSKMFPTSAIGGVMDALGVQPPIPAEHVRQAREFLSGLPARAEIPANVPTVGPAFDPGIEKGVNQFVDEMGSGLTRPDQAFSIAATGKFPAVMGRTFQLAPVVDLPQQIQQMQQASESGDVAGTAKSAAGIASGALLPFAIQKGFNEHADLGRQPTDLSNNRVVQSAPRPARITNEDLQAQINELAADPGVTGKKLVSLDAQGNPIYQDQIIDTAKVRQLQNLQDLLAQGEIKTAQTKGKSNASQVPSPTKVHGDLQSPPIAGEGEVPTAEGGGGIQPQASGGIPATPEPAQPARPREENQVPLAKPAAKPNWDSLYQKEHADLVDLQKQIDHAKEFEPDIVKSLEAEKGDIIQRLGEFDKLSKSENRVTWETPKETAQAMALRENPNLSAADAHIEGQRMRRQDIEDRIHDDEPVPAKAYEEFPDLKPKDEAPTEAKAPVAKPLKVGEAPTPADIHAATHEEFMAYHDAMKAPGEQRAAVNEFAKSLDENGIKEAERLAQVSRDKAKEIINGDGPLETRFKKSMEENQRTQFLAEGARTAKAMKAVEEGSTPAEAAKNLGVPVSALETPKALEPVAEVKAPEPVKPVEAAKPTEQSAISERLRKQRARETEDRRGGLFQKLMKQSDEELRASAKDISAEDKQWIKDRLDAAPGDAPRIRQALGIAPKEEPAPLPVKANGKKAPASKQAELTFEEQKAEQAASRGAEVSATPQEVTPSAQALGFAAPATKFGNGTLNVGNAFKHATEKVGDFWRSFSMQELPKITKSDRPTGEAGVRYAASPYVARAKGAEMAGKVLDGFKPDMDLKMGTAISEDNLRSIQKGFQDEAQALAKKGDLEGAEKAQKAASNVATLVGQKNSPFKTEADYQAFLKSPEFQDASARYDALWQSEKDPLFRQANDLDPDLPLESRGLQTGLRVNLKAVPKEEGTATTIGNAGKRTLIKQTATLLKRDPFAQRAKGSGTSYEGSLTELLSHGFEREYPVATQHEFIKSLIDSGDAVLTQKEYMPDLKIKGEATKGYLQKLRPFAGRFLHIRKSLALEYQAVSGLDPAVRLPIYSGVADFLTRQSVAGLAEGSTHVANIATEMFTGLGPTANPLINAVLKAAGRADVLWSLPKIIMKGFSDNASEMLKLKTIGAGKQEFKSGGIFKPMSAIINGMDKGSRIVAADVYKGMAKEGWVEDTETGLRQYVNKVGQYEKRLQPLIIRVLRDTGVQPFATAAHTFNVQALRNIVLAPGAKSPTNLGALSLRIEKAAGILGAAALIAGLNQLLSGKPEGPKGTKLGEVGWIGDDHKVHKFDVLGLMGYRRSLSRTGIGPVIEAKRAGLTGNQQLKQGVEAIANTGVSYVSGPLNRALTVGATGYRPSVPPIRESKAVPPVDKFAPLKSQTAENIKTALQQANPLVDAVASQVQGKTGTEIAQRQLSRFTPRTGTTETKAAALPKIVKASELNDYSDNLAKALRKLDRIERYRKAKEEMADMQPKDRTKVLDKLRRQGVFTYQ
jgi:hypothetical protein